MKKTVLLGLLALSCCYMEACQDNRKAKNYNSKTLVDDAGIAFVTNVMEGGNTEIAAAQLAEKQSTNPRVLNFAKMMIADHSASGKQLQQIANNKYVTIIDTISQDHKNMIKSLSGKTGADFDKAYMQMMVTDHEKVVQLFHDATENTNATLNSFAEKNIGKMQMHLDSAKAINSSLK